LTIHISCFHFLVNADFIGGVMVSVLASSTIDREFDP
jgi:hypothetical protein